MTKNIHLASISKSVTVRSSRTLIYTIKLTMLLTVEIQVKSIQIRTLISSSAPGRLSWSPSWLLSTWNSRLSTLDSISESQPRKWPTLLSKLSKQSQCKIFQEWSYHNVNEFEKHSSKSRNYLVNECLAFWTSFLRLVNLSLRFAYL